MNKISLNMVPHKVAAFPSGITNILKVDLCEMHSAAQLNQGWIHLKPLRYSNSWNLYEITKMIEWFKFHSNAPENEFINLEMWYFYYMF